jgi:hypothetical protein
MPLTLLKYKALGNLVTCTNPAHTPFTYHRTWETGLEVAASPLLLTPIFLPFSRLKYPNRQQFSTEPRRKSPLPQRNFLQSGVYIRKSRLRKA